jgi:MFS family permease
VAGVARSAGLLIAARGLQGLGAALIAPAALSLLAVTFDEGRERNRALGSSVRSAAHRDPSVWWRAAC